MAKHDRIYRAGYADALLGRDFATSFKPQGWADIAWRGSVYLSGYLDGQNERAKRGITITLPPYQY